LWNAELLCLQYSGFDVVPEFAQPCFDFGWRLSIFNTRDARYILHHDEPGHDVSHHPQVFSEQPRPLIMHSALMVIDTECLTWRPADKNIQVSPSQPADS